MSDQPSFKCPDCGAVSYHPEDIRHRYCGRCHVFVDDPKADFKSRVMSDERIKITPVELDAMMPPGEYVHTFIQANSKDVVLIGADRSRQSILELAAGSHGAELSGEYATAMKHGALVWDKELISGKPLPVFVATRQEGLRS